MLEVSRAANEIKKVQGGVTPRQEMTKYWPNPRFATLRRSVKAMLLRSVAKHGPREVTDALDPFAHGGPGVARGGPGAERQVPARYALAHLPGRPEVAAATRGPFLGRV